MGKKGITLAVVLMVLTIVSTVTIYHFYFGAVRNVAITQMLVSLDGPLAGDIERAYAPLTGDILNLTVIVENRGTTTEDFNVSLQLESATLETKEVNDLSPSAAISLTYFWNTTLSPVGDYDAKAEVSAIQGETNTTDNVFVANTIRLRNGPTGKETVSLIPQASSAGLSEHINLNITIEDVSDLYAWQLDLEYNSSVLLFLEATEGDFLKENSVGKRTLFISRPESEEPQVFVGCTLMDEVVGVTGSGTVATLVFEVVQAESCNLQLLNTLLLDSLQVSISHATVDGTFHSS